MSEVATIAGNSEAGPEAIARASVANGGLIRLDPHQELAFWSELRTLFLLWRRQAGKSFTLGSWSLRRMAENPGHLVILCSASIGLGREWIYKEAQVWRMFTQAYRDFLATRGEERSRFTTVADDDAGRLLDIDAIADLFEYEKLETRLYHSRSIYSRSVVVAPNPATAVGWTGDVGMDEVGRIGCLAELLEAIGPIMTRHPHFRMRLATTISPDDTHISRDIHGYPAEQREFPVRAEGNLYVSKTGYTVHRFDAHDGQAAGLKLYDDRTGKELTPEEHRAAALDKAGWDRNYALLETTGGTAAIPSGVLTRCLTQGRGQCVAADITQRFGEADIPSLFPPEWESLIDPNGPRLALGYDVATTTKKKSNPSAITLAQEVGLHIFARLILRFKADDPTLAWAIIEHILRSLPHGLRVRTLCIDASNERYHAVQTRSHFAGRLPVELIVSGETLDFRGERMNYKTFLGNQAIATAADGYLALPSLDWIEKDWRLVKLEKGVFFAETDDAGNHGDTWDSTKQAIHALRGAGGPVAAAAVPTGSLDAGRADRPGVLRGLGGRLRAAGRALLHV
jgi:hypothetical protein